MQLTNVLVVFGLVAAASANPLETRNWNKAKGCDWECEKYYPKCDNGWKPMYCPKGWGEDWHGCYDWSKYFLPP